MNYKKIYESLIKRGQTRTLDCYTESHHIIPRCLGGDDEITNLVNLTPEEHYVAHQLLVKIYPNDKKLVHAAAMMIPKRPTNKMYGWLKRRHSEAMSISQSGEKNSQFGTRWIYNPITEETKKIDCDIPDGWFAGRKSKKIYQKKTRTYVDPVKLQNDIDIYREYYKLYCSVGFEEFIKQTGYKYSKPNLVQRFKKLLPEFVPQNGKKR